MATKTITGQVQIRNDTAHNWAVENPVLLPGELGLETDTGNGKFGDGETTWNSLKYAFRRNNTRNIEYIVGTQTAATPSFTGVSEDSELYDGKCINYYLPFAGTSAGDTLNLTLADGTKTGAKPIYIVNTTKLTTHYVAGTVFMMTYSATKDAWYCGNYWTDGNTYDRNLLNDIRVTAGTNKIMNYSLVMQKADGTWESCTTTSGTGTSKTKNTSGFRLGKIWVYNYNETIAANALTRNDYLYDCMPHTLTYSTNCGTTLVAHKPVYLVGTIGNDGLFYLDTPWWTQTEPTTEDGKVYIYLGDAYSTSAIYKVSHNPIYEYRDGAFRPYTSRQASNTINAMTGYTKASEKAAIQTTDTLNEAIGKLERRLDPTVAVAIQNPGTEVWIEVPVEHIVVGAVTPTDTDAIWLEVSQ